jgi:phage terminase large subunit
MAYLGPNYSQVEKVSWNMLKEYTKNIPGVSYNEAKLRCVIPRPWLDDKVTFYLLGAESPDSIRGIYLDGVILDEFQLMESRIWGEVVRPLLSDRKGWAIFIGTPKGQNVFYDMYKVACENESGQWFTALYKASQTGIIPEDELTAIRAEVDEDAYQQEFECNWAAALTGAYWGKQMSQMEQEKRICNVPHDSALMVDTFFDLGVNDSTTIIFTQQFRNEIRVIDYIEMSGEGLPYYIKKMREGHRSSYIYREHNWPHDGAARDFSSNGATREQLARDLGLKPLRVHKKFDIMDSIDACRRLLPRMLIDQTKGARFIDCLKAYEKKWDDKNKIYQDRPLHNWASHGADAFRLMAMALRPGDDRHGAQSRLPSKCNSKYNIFKR